MTDDPAWTRQAVRAVAQAVEREHDFAGWLADVLARVARVHGSSDALTAGRPGSWEAALVQQLLAGTVGEHDQYLPPGRNTTMTHDHARPGIADMRTALAVTRAILGGASLAANHRAVEGGSCPACVALAGISFGITVASTMAGDKMFVSERVRFVFLDALDAAEAELGSAPN